MKVETGFFELASDGKYVPTPAAHSPWSTSMIHGRLLAALASREIEARAGEFRPARVTSELFRAAPMAPVEVHSGVVRDGGRVRVVEAEVICEGREVLRARAMLLRPGAQPPGRVWEPPPWSTPDPERLPHLSARSEEGATVAVEGEGTPTEESPSWLDIRPVHAGGLDTEEQKGVWIRELKPLVGGDRDSQFVRAVAAADLANPFGNFGDAGLHFINADLSLYLGRLPEGDWLGLRIASRCSSDGISTVAADLYDRSGLVGHCGVGSVATGMFGTG